MINLNLLISNLYYLPIFLFLLSLFIYILSLSKINPYVSRKFFHLIVFICAGLTLHFLDFIGLFYYGSAGVMIFSFLVYKKSKFLKPFIRKTDKQRPYFYILFPLFSTVLATLVSYYFFGAKIIIAFFILGIADCLAEFVGVNYGKRKYSLFKNKKTLEGSSAFFLGSISAFVLAGHLLNFNTTDQMTVISILSFSFSLAIIEGITPHGWDNFTIILAASYLSGFLV